MYKFLILILIFSINSFAYTFKDALKAISNHESVDAISKDALAIKEQADVSGSWGDPMLKLAAKNFPVESLANDKAPMTGVELSIAQKIAITNKYSKMKAAFINKAKAREFDSFKRKDLLIKDLWMVLIESRKLNEERKILKENFQWIQKNLKITKKLYSNGKLSQQALLDVQIRKSELQTEISNKSYELRELSAKLNYLVDAKGLLDTRTIPWNVLSSNSNKREDYSELAFKSNLKASENLLASSKLNYVPDLTVSVGYTKRSDVFDNGDFVSASISFPIPTSDTKYSNHSKASYEKIRSANQLADYKKYKMSKKQEISLSIKKTKNEISTLKSETLKFAENSRKVTSKSYELGETGYIELLKSELKLQTLLLKKTMLRAKLAVSQINLKFLLGESLQ